MYMKGNTMKKVKFLFLILHYMVEDMTLQCVESISQKCANDDYHIVIVDNGSGNGSGLNISNKLEDDAKCDVILSETNLGFARGNNLGWEYIRNYFDAEFVIVLNNDVLLIDDGFCGKIEYLYGREHFYLLGPDIYASRCGIHQNPSSLAPLSKDELVKIKNNFEHRAHNFAFSYVKQTVLRYVRFPLKKIMRVLRPEWFSVPAYYKAKAVLDPVLHGACLIYSKDFLKREKYAFSPETFMYMEEYILHYYCSKKQYKMLYSSEIMVHHLEDVSTDATYKTNYKKERMKEIEMAKSIGVLLKIMGE